MGGVLRQGKEKEDASGEESSLSDLEQEEEPPKPTPSKRKASAKVEDGIPSKVGRWVMSQLLRFLTTPPSDREKRLPTLRSRVKRSPRSR